MEHKSVLIIVMDVTPSWWGLCETEDMSLPQCTEAVLGFSNLHLMFSPMNELVIIGVTPESAEIMWPASQSLPKPNTDAQRDGQYDLLGFMNDYVRRQILRRIASTESSGTSVRLASGIAKGLCYYVRTCRDLQPTKRYDEELNINSGVEALDIADKVSARMLVVRAGEDSPSQYLALMNAVFTAQKLRMANNPSATSGFKRQATEAIDERAWKMMEYPVFGTLPLSFLTYVITYSKAKLMSISVYIEGDSGHEFALCD
ncbi:hypothetical protein X801_06492, partial [Opisthorchis viverrini]